MFLNLINKISYYLEQILHQKRATLRFTRVFGVIINLWCRYYAVNPEKKLKIIIIGNDNALPVL